MGDRIRELRQRGQKEAQAIATLVVVEANRRIQDGWGYQDRVAALYDTMQDVSDCVMEEMKKAAEAERG